MYRLGKWIVRWTIEKECTLNKFTDDRNLGEVTDTPDGCASIQRDLNRPEKWADRNLTKFSKGKCKVWHLRRNKPYALVHTESWKAALQSRR